MTLTSPASNNRSWKRHLLALATPLLCFALIAIHQSTAVDNNLLREQLTHHLGQYDFVSTRHDKLAIYQTTSFIEYFQRHIGRLPGRLLDPHLMLSVGAPVLAMLTYAYTAFRIKPVSLDSAALLCAIAAPLAFHAVAGDTARLSTYVLASVFFALWILSETRTAHRPHSIFLLLGLAALAINLFWHIPLMDQQKEALSAMQRLILYSPSIALFAIISASRLRQETSDHDYGY